MIFFLTLSNDGAILYYIKQNSSLDKMKCNIVVGYKERFILCQIHI